MHKVALGLVFLRVLLFHQRSVLIRSSIGDGKGQGKGFPLQAWNGSWGSRRLRLLNLLDFRHYEGGKVVTLTHRPPSPPGVFLVLIFRGSVDPRAHGIGDGI